MPGADRDAANLLAELLTPALRSSCGSRMPPRGQCAIWAARSLTRSRVTDRWIPGHRKATGCSSPSVAKAKPQPGLDEAADRPRLAVAVNPVRGSPQVGTSKSTRLLGSGRTALGLGSVKSRRGGDDQPSTAEPNRPPVRICLWFTTVRGRERLRTRRSAKDESMTFPPVTHVAIVRDLSVSVPWSIVTGRGTRTRRGHRPRLPPHRLPHWWRDASRAAPAQVAWPAEPFSEYRVGLDHVVFGCESREELEKWARRLDQFGVEHDGIKDADYGSGLSFRDPDGIALEFCAASVDGRVPARRTIPPPGARWECQPGLAPPPGSGCSLPRSQGGAAARRSSGPSGCSTGPHQRSRRRVGTSSSP